MPTAVFDTNSIGIGPQYTFTADGDGIYILPGVDRRLGQWRIRP